MIAASDIAKQTFHNHFPSKEQVILEVMLYQERECLQWFEEAVGKRGKTATEKLLATFDVLEESLSLDVKFINFVKVDFINQKYPSYFKTVILRKI